MAKINDQSVEEQSLPLTRQPATALLRAPDLLLKFRDKLYTSRTLCIPGTDRTLAVAKHVVEVSASDEQAVSFLKTHPELEPLE
ncbi:MULTISPECIES: hypothetical protein [Pseudomonas]|uniref:Uncharacterized protein n=3 Tax=Pseudomonas TaxID=286 RepID=A0ABX4Q7B4_9PSED|nr:MULTISPECIES: hypothetical protein [Pseudomonas]MDD0969728.1 hypothetical protein [Pseudomonas aphyarum]MDD1127808.1 hypothetical protein [Pseudomonas aphyarum]PKA72603.1 hypothetical protein ATI02_5675 [Pseudomonas baetica]PTC16958.1 hypothetical protein C0J26_23715 [Pseudomonas baetica]